MIYLMWFTIIGLLLVPPVIIARLQTPYVPLPQPEPRASAEPAVPVEVSKALQLLHLPKDATEEEIKDAHRRMIQQSHPDAGGSIARASLINRARDVLLKNRQPEDQAAA